MSKKDKYCSYCGAKMTKIYIYANHAKVFHFDGMGGSYGPAGTQYDTETGKPQFVADYECPNIGEIKGLPKKWWQRERHDKYTNDEIERGK